MTGVAEPAPTISMILPNYNHGKYLRQTLDSLLGQTYRDFELIIIDDGSTDNSWSIIKEYADKDPRIVAEKFPENRGAEAAIKRCNALCRGKYVFGRASDDYMINPLFLEQAMQAMDLYPNAAGVFAGSQLIDGTTGDIRGDMGLVMGFQRKEDYNEFSITYISKEQAQKEFLARRLFIPGASSLWRRDFTDQIGGYDPALGPQTDYFLNHALPMLHGVAQIHNLAVAVRVDPGSYSSSAGDESFFKRHALVEKKMRALIKGVAHDDGWMHWREDVIRSRIPDLDQSCVPPRQFNSGLLTFLNRVYGYLLRKTRAIGKWLPSKRQEAEKALQQRRQQAHALFEKVVQNKDMP